MFRRTPALRPPAPPPLWETAPHHLATEADIVACFRLLLGRAPHQAEWPIHAAKVGTDLRSAVASFTHSPEFAHRGLLPPPADQPDDRATAADIHSCFRLILGRAPNPEEWLGHATKIGDPLDRVVASYTGSLEFAERRLTLARHQGQITLSQQNGFAIYVAEDDAAVGQHVAGGAYEPDVTAVFRRLLRPGHGVIDIGANIGYFTMLAAALVGPQGRVLAVEPNPRNARMLEASRRANGFDHVRICQAAAGRRIGLLALNTAHSNGTTSDLAEREALLEADTVACLPVDRLLDAHERVDFVKVDVEGAEYNALLGCRRILETHRPIIVSEFSPDMIGSISGITGPAYLDWLIGLGTTLAVIAPDGSDSGPLDPAAIMTIYTQRRTDHIDVLATFT